MKKTSLVAIVALTASVMADDMSKSNAQKMQRSERPDSGMMNVSSYPMIDSNKWDLFADALYWYVAEGNTDWAVVNKNEATVNTEHHFRKVDFEWNWGFKVGIGYNMMKHDEWDTQLQYTWLRASKKEVAGIASLATAVAPYGTGIDSVFTVPDSISSSTFKNGTINWDVHFSMFDWELARGYYVSKHLSLRPHVGLKGGWINQHVHGHFHSFANVSQTFSMDNDFWGIGPSGGVNTKWNLGNVNTHFFSMLGDFSGSLMWGHWTLHQHNQDSVNHKQEFDSRNRNQAASMLHAFFGFGWDANFNKDRSHFFMKLGYELQYWFAQNQLLNVVAQNGQYGDLSLQGGTLEIRFDF